MRFKIEKLILGNVKKVTKFAWSPITISNELVWLEKYNIVYVCQELPFEVNGTIFEEMGTELKWVFVKNEVID